MREVLVGRQPIFNTDLTVYGYELLFRRGESDRADFVDGSAATNQVVLNSFLEIGLDHLVGSGRAFINFTEDLLLGDACAALPSERVVIEVLETVGTDEAVVQSLRGLAKSGFVIALDDFTYRAEMEPLIETCHIVKFDVLALGHEGMQQQVAKLKSRKVRLLAEKVGTYEDFEFCKGLGCELFQGYFLCRPNIVRGANVPSNRPAILRLLARLQQPEAEVDSVVADISMDVALVYKLLRFVNSAVCGLSRRVNSLRDAVLYVGTNRIRFWASLVLLGSVEDKPRELVSVALQRARMCESIASGLGANEALKSQHFSVGLFSVLDAVFDRPMTELLRELNLSDVTQDALLHHSGSLGSVLHSVLAYESGDWEQISSSGVDAGTAKAAYLDSIAWAKATMREILSAA